ncbi:recombinase family protein [Aromatoleum evansii]|uniref:recombinase family protein n=1 Tax=Aromatoleum evansii TaxID=59406 RepID=UPI00145F2FF2|nr:recombinase family protein [Aromatoleum evansii]NMG28080.1 hypothetical protein [Aromatoleum evansii]
MLMTIIAFYLRYSGENQSPTSIEDQKRRCLELAERQGFSTAHVLFFEDAEVSGYKYEEAQNRPGYKALLAAWDRGEFNVLFVDEFCRLARNYRQIAELEERLDRGDVRLITANGIDSNSANGRFLIGLYGVLAAEESRSISFRVTRGMTGQLVRGYMIAQPPYGYRGERKFAQDGRAVGTVWHIHEPEAEIVREMYQRRLAGAAFAEIAAWLNDSGVKTSRRGRVWRPAAVQRVLENPIYCGEFRLNASSFSKYQAKKSGKQLKIVPFPRPDLRLVSDEVWKLAQGPGISRTGYGGGRNHLSGLIHCNCCGSVLSVTNAGSRMACGTCVVNSRVGAPGAPTRVPSVSVAGLNAVVGFALRHVFDDERIALIRARLRERLDGGPAAELARLKRLVTKAQNEAQQLARMIRRSDGPDEILEREYDEAKAALREAERSLKDTESAHIGWSGAEIAAQLDVDATTLGAKLLDGRLDAPAVRAVLTQLFPRFVFMGRKSRHVALFELDFAPGVAVAWLSGTSSQIDERVRMSLRLELATRQPLTWSVECLHIEVVAFDNAPC